MITVERRRAAAPSYDPNTLLLIPGTGANNSTNIIDTSQYARSITVSGDAKITTAIADPFGASAGVMTYDGAADYLQIAYDSALDLTAAHTVEFFFRRVTTGNIGLFSKGGGAAAWSPTNGAELIVFIDGGVLYMQYYTGGISQMTFSTSPPAINTWAHFATTYDGTTTRCFLGGASFGTPTTTTPTKPSTNNIYQIGTHLAFSSGAALMMNGQVVQFRHSATALYTANFTPPIAPFTP